MSDVFDWKSGASDVVFPSVQGVAVYRNQKEDVVIRQEAGPLDDDDVFIIIPAAHVAAFIEALQSVVEG